MSVGDHDTPTPDPVVSRRWRVFLTVECVLACAWGIGYCAHATSRAPDFVERVLLPALGVWLFVSLPTAVLYLVSSLPGLEQLWPPGPSPQERAYRQEVGSRPALTDQEFYGRFYEGSD